MGAGLSCAVPEETMATTKTTATTPSSNNRVSAERSPRIYHERQSRELCAVHALNNLFQDRHAFSKKTMDEICVKLSPETYINPHRSLIGLGNYDVNVIMAALQARGCDVVWFDKRRDVGSLLLGEIKGFILNVPSDMRWGFVRLPLTRRHWIAVRQVDDVFYNLDSKLDAPERIGTEKELLTYLREQMQSAEKEVLLVVEQAEGERALWSGQQEKKLSAESNGDSGVFSAGNSHTDSVH